MASKLRGGWCWFALAGLIIPLAVVLAVIFETPVVTRLELPAQGGASAAAAPAAESATPLSAGSESPEFGIATDSHGSGAMFDRIAFVYDSTNRWMALGLDTYWREQLIQDCLQLQPEDYVLDLATGTADVGILEGHLLSEIVKENGTLESQTPGQQPRVIGVDPSSEMLRRGVSKVQAGGLRHMVTLFKGDAQNLSTVRTIDAEGALGEPSAGVETDSIDKISMAFGIRNVPDRSLALREMRRVLRNKATSRVCILEFALPSGDTLLSSIARKFITHVVPFIGRIATLGQGSKEYEYLEKSILMFPQPLEFAASMAELGLPVETITSFAFGAVHIYKAVPMGVSAQM